MGLKFDGSSMAPLLGTQTGGIRTNTHKAAHFFSLASFFEECDFKNAGWWWFRDHKADEKCSCVHWTSHAKTCFRNQIFHWWSLFILFYMLWNGAVLYRLFSQINILELDIILLPLDLGRSISVILKDAPLLNWSVGAMHKIYIMKFMYNNHTHNFRKFSSYYSFVLFVS